MAELIKFKKTNNADMERGWHTDKWVAKEPSSHATSGTITESTIERNATGTKTFEFLTVLMHAYQ